MNRALHGSCHVPVAALARLQDGGGLLLQGLVGSEADGRTVRAEARGHDPDQVGRAVAQRLLDFGAGDFLPPPD